MHGVGVTVLVAVVAFVGTMTDNFIAFSAQMALTEPARRRRAHVGQFVALLAVVAGAALIGASLGDVPLRWVGVLALVPLALAVNRWRHPRRGPRKTRRGSIATFLLTVAFGGDNFAVWIPLFRAGGLRNGAVTATVFLLADVVFLVLAGAVADRARVAAFTQRRGPALVPILYVALAVVVAWECRWF